MLAELAEEPATIEGEFNHNWGTADTLHKSKAIEAFGAKYLLGVFETKDEAKTVFAEWNGEFGKAHRDTEGQEHINEVL